MYLFFRRTKQADHEIAQDELFILNPHDSHRQLSVTDEKFIIEMNADLFQAKPFSKMLLF
ncbi:hypothetical protein JOC34_003903 [Virgibacillus halotolerans]|nr:hypothetical protein [Virgibacillus halotolerans]